MYLGTLYLREACVPTFSLGRCSLFPTMTGQAQLQAHQLIRRGARCLLRYTFSIVDAYLPSPIFFSWVAANYVPACSDRQRSNDKLHYILVHTYYLGTIV